MLTKTSGGMTMEIRSAVPSDLEELLKYDRHILPELLRECIHSGRVDVLTGDGKILGLLRWSLFWQSIPFLDLIYLGEALRGQRWGTRMMDRWAKCMAELGHAHVLLSTQEDETARFFYEKLGYTLCGSFLPPKQDERELIYRKELNP